MKPGRLLALPSLKISLVISFHILLVSLFIYLLEKDKVRVTFLKHADGMYMFWNDKLFMNGLVRSKVNTGHDSFAFNPRSHRGVNDLISGFGNFKVTDFHFPKPSEGDVDLSYLPSIITTANFLYLPLGYIVPFAPGMIKTNLTLPERYWISFDYYHPVVTSYMFRVFGSSFEFKQGEITNEFNFTRCNMNKEVDPDVPVSFYIKRILFTFIFAGVAGAFIRMFYLGSGSILNLIFNGRKNKVESIEAIHENQLAETIDHNKKWLLTTEIFTIFSVTFLVVFYYTYFHLDHVPRVVDEAGYMFQAKIFASGHLSVPAPDYINYLDFPGIALFRDTTKVYHRPGFPGLPLLLALGMKVNAPWIIPPLLMGTAFVFIFLTGLELFSRWVAWGSVLLGLTSPWITVLGASFMPHGAELCFGIMFMFFQIKFLQTGRWCHAIGASVAFGIEVLVRPFTSFCLAIPFILPTLLKFGSRPRDWMKLIAMVLVIGFLAGLLFLYIREQGVVCGLNEEIQKSNNLRRWNPPIISASNYFVNLTELQYSLFGWPAYLTLMFFMLSFFFLPKTDVQKSLLITFLSVSVLYSLKGHFGWCYEPRYWYAAVPSLLIFTAAGIEHIGILLTRSLKSYRFFGLTACIIPILLVTINFLPVKKLRNNFLTELDRTRVSGWYWRQFDRFDDYCNIRTGLRDWVEKVKPKNALVFVGGGPPIWTMTPIIPLINLDFKGDVIFVKDMESRATNQKMIEKFPGRQVFWSNNGNVIPYSSYLSNGETQHRFQAAQPLVNPPQNSQPAGQSNSETTKDSLSSPPAPSSESIDRMPNPTQSTVNTKGKTL
jgi:hypothetical protein